MDSIVQGYWGAGAVYKLQRKGEGNLGQSDGPKKVSSWVWNMLSKGKILMVDTDINIFVTMYVSRISLLNSVFGH